MRLSLTRYRTLAAAFVFLTAVAVGARPSPAAAGSVVPFPGTTLASAVEGVATTGGLATVTRIGTACPLIYCKIIGGVSIAFALYAEKDALVHAYQSGRQLIDYLGPGPATYPASFDDGTISGTVVSVSGRTLTLGMKCSVWNYNSGSGGSTIWKCGAVTTGLGSNISITTDQSTVTDVDCENTSTHVHVTRALTLTGMQQGAYAVAASAPASTFTNYASTLCLSGEQIDGFRLSGRSTGTQGAGSVFRQTAPIGWGTLSGGVARPEGAVEFGSSVIEVTCKNAKTGDTATMAKTSPWINETLVVPSCKAKYGKDWYGLSMRIIPQDPKINGNALPDGTWPGWTDPAVPKESWTPDGVTPEVAAMPCYTTSSGCSLTIWIDGNPVFPGEFSWTKIGTIHDGDASRATCHWGTITVDWKMCQALKGAFESPSGLSNIDPNVGAVADVPRVNPSVPEGVPADPVPGTPTPPSDLPNGGADCMAGVTGWNPLTYVYAGTKCALRWAFVPSGASTFQTTVTAFQTRPPGSLIAGSVSAVTGGLSSFTSGGCGTLGTIPIPGPDLVISCPEIAAMSGFSAYYVAVQALFIGSGVFAAFRMITGSVRKGGDG